MSTETNTETKIEPGDAILIRDGAGHKWISWAVPYCDSWHPAVPYCQCGRIYLTAELYAKGTKEK